MTTAFITLTAETCCKCGCVYGINEEVRSRFQREGGTFYCTNGHGQGYTKTDTQRLREQLAEKERELTAAKCRELDQRAAAERAQRENRRIKRRIHAGVCPCCNRTFTNLARHMATKHPENVPSTQTAKGTP